MRLAFLVVDSRRTQKSSLFSIVEATQKPRCAKRGIHELKELVIISFYLYITLGTVILIKTAVLHTDGINFAPWGIAVVKAVVLAKFMLLGEAMKIGEHTALSR